MLVSRSLKMNQSTLSLTYINASVFTKPRSNQWIWSSQWRSCWMFYVHSIVVGCQYHITVSIYICDWSIGKNISSPLRHYNGTVGLPLVPCFEWQIGMDVCNYSGTSCPITVSDRATRTWREPKVIRLIGDIARDVTAYSRNSKNLSTYNWELCIKRKSNTIMSFIHALLHNLRF